MPFTPVADPCLVPEGRHSAWCSWLWCHPPVAARAKSHTVIHIDSNTSRRRDRSRTASQEASAPRPSSKERTPTQPKSALEAEQPARKDERPRKDDRKSVPLSDQPCSERCGRYQRDCCHGEDPPKHCHRKCCSRHCQKQMYSCSCADCQEQKRQSDIAWEEALERRRKTEERRADPNHIRTREEELEDLADDVIHLTLLGAGVALAAWGVHCIVQAMSDD